LWSVRRGLEGLTDDCREQKRERERAEDRRWVEMVGGHTSSRKMRSNNKKLRIRIKA